jgi:ABC-type transport system involved in multi-copper enzyme maturation permease subunit
MPIPKVLHAALGLTALNPIAIRLVGAASRRNRDYFIRTGFVSLLATNLLLGLFGVLASGRLSLRDLAAGSAQIFTFLSVVELILICLLTPIFMAGAIAKEAQPRTWDIMLTTPLSALQIVLGNLLGRLFFIATLLISALPLMTITQFFGGVRGETILLTQLIAFCLAMLIGSFAIATSVTRTAGRKAVITFFVITICYLAITWSVDKGIRVPVSAGSLDSWTTLITPFNPLLVLEALLSPTSYVIPDTSDLFWPLGYAITNPVAAWCWFTVILSLAIVAWASLQVRKLGDQSKKLPSLLLRSTAPLHKPKVVTGNPIAWRERVTRHRNMSSLFGRWGFAAVGLLTIIVTTTLFATDYWSADVYRSVVSIIIGAEIVILILAAIYVSASSITKEREDGSLDLLLTTSMTPQTYLSGKVRGIVIHLLPMVATPCVSSFVVGFAALIMGDQAFVSDIPVGKQVGEMNIPLALWGPSMLLPVVLIPFLAFCVTLGLQWSLRSKGSIRAVASTLMMMVAISFGLGICMTPAGSMGVAGAFVASLSPIPYLVAITSPAGGILPSLIQGGVTQTTIALVISAPIAGAIWILASWGLLRSIAASFVKTVRRLAGTN